MRRTALWRKLTVIGMLTGPAIISVIVMQSNQLPDDLMAMQFRIDELASLRSAVQAEGRMDDFFDDVLTDAMINYYADGEGSQPLGTLYQTYQEQSSNANFSLMYYAFGREGPSLEAEEFVRLLQQELQVRFAGLRQRLRLRAHELNFEIEQEVMQDSLSCTFIFAGVENPDVAEIYFSSNDGLSIHRVRNDSTLVKSLPRIDSLLYAHREDWGLDIEESLERPFSSLFNVYYMHRGQKRYLSSSRQSYRSNSYIFEMSEENIDRFLEFSEWAEQEAWLPDSCTFKLVDEQAGLPAGYRRYYRAYALTDEPLLAAPNRNSVEHEFSAGVDVLTITLSEDAWQAWREAGHAEFGEDFLLQVGYEDLCVVRSSNTGGRATLRFSGFQHPEQARCAAFFQVPRNIDEGLVYTSWRTVYAPAWL